METDDAGRPNRWGWLETLVLGLYAVVVATGITWHEPWADEAQAWLLARDLGWWPLVSHAIRYEGSPGLWHSMLWILNRLHAGYTGMHWLAGAFAVAAVVVLLRYAPFPRVLRMVLPFTFFLAYQDAVIARSYVVFTVLAFGAAALLRSRSLSVCRSPRSGWLLALLLGLMANLSIHCFLASLGLACVAWRQRARLNGGLGGPAVLLVVCWALAIASAFPPADVAFPAGKNIAESWKKAVAALEHKHYVRPAELSDTGTRGPDELVPQAPPVHHRTGWQNVTRKVGRLLALVTFPLSSFRILGLLAAGLVVAQVLVRPHSGVGPVALTPYLLLLTVFWSLYIAPRHMGVVLVTLLVTAWLSWPEENSARWRRVLTAVLLMVSVEQVGWTAHALWSDIRGPYSGGPMTAEFFRSHAPGRRVDGFYYHSVAVLPYFDHNIFANQHAASYWDWSGANHNQAEAPAAWRTHPDYVVVSGFDWGNTPDITVDWQAFEDPRGPSPPLGDDYGLLPWFEQHGYHETHRFCGHAWMRSGYSELLCDVVLEPSAAARP